MKFAIVGSGVAAFEAAVTLRERSEEAEITLYSREAVLPYRRPALSRMASEEVSDAQFYIKPAAFYAEKRIGLKLSHRLVTIDPAAKALSFDNGETANYDKLLLATGSRCFLPPIPGIELDGVLALREFSDLQELRRRLDSGVRRVVVIGGGLLGLELAESLLKRGCHVTVIEGCPKLLPRNLDAEAAEAVQRQLGKIPNLVLHFGNCVGSIRGEGGKVSEVELTEQVIPAELVMVSAGTRPNIAEAKAAGIACSRGIVVDRFLQSSASGVYAAGDCAEVEGVTFGLYNAAKGMGDAAALNMLGEKTAFKAEVYPARLSVFGLKIFSAGKLEDVKSEVESDAAGNFQKRFYNAAGELTGCILIGDLRAASRLQAEIKE